MTDQRKQEVIAQLQDIQTNFVPVNDAESPNFEPELTMFGLISRYNTTGLNTELIGGQWVIENCPEPLCSLTC